jgi:predicted phage-related endonuclease
MLSPDQIRMRDGRLTASRVACLMTGDPEKLMGLWREMTGDPTYEPEDLSGVWAVQLGSHTESLNLAWYERRTGKPLSRMGDVVIHPQYDWAACTLDAWDDDLAAPVECKHVGGFEKTEAILARYAPQAHWQMIVTGSKKCVFSLIEGAREPVIETVNYDEGYAAELWSRAEQFMECVSSLTPPVILPPVQPPAKPEKAYDYTKNNQWVSEALAWIVNRPAAKDFTAAERELKALVPPDAIRVFGGGIECRRDKAGRLSIKEIA